MDLASFTLHIERTLNPALEKFVSPKKLGRMATVLPGGVNFAILQKILNSTFSEQLAEGDFDFLSGRGLQIEIADADLFIGLSYRQQSLTCHHFNHIPCQSDVTLSLDTLDAIRLIQQEVDPDTLFFQRKLKIKGDTELAHHVKNTLDTLNPDAIPRFLLKMLEFYRQRVLK